MSEIENGGLMFLPKQEYRDGIYSLLVNAGLVSFILLLVKGKLFALLFWQAENIKSKIRRSI